MERLVRQQLEDTFSQWIRQEIPKLTSVPSPPKRSYNTIFQSIKAIQALKSTILFIWSFSDKEKVLSDIDTRSHFNLWIFLLS